MELQVDKVRGLDALNKKIFYSLRGHKEDIEQSFGEPLIWDCKEGRRSCRIGCKREGEGLRNEERWDDIQERMIEKMIKLIQALKLFLKKVPEK